jgi:hypothetical protein
LRTDKELRQRSITEWIWTDQPLMPAVITSVCLRVCEPKSHVRTIGVTCLKILASSPSAFASPSFFLQLVKSDRNAIVG